LYFLSLNYHDWIPLVHQLKKIALATSPEFLNQFTEEDVEIGPISQNNKNILLIIFQIMPIACCTKSICILDDGVISRLYSIIR